MRETSPPRLGIAITTYNRRAMLLAQVAALRELTSCRFELVVCDDGSADDTVAAVRALGVPVIAGTNRGIAWNKNRGLFYLREIVGADIILLLDDDVLPTRQGWEQEWIAAAGRYGHVNYLPAHEMFSGGNRPEDPSISDSLWGPCIAFSRAALGYVGYFDTRFTGYGHEHTDFTTRAIRAGFGGFVTAPNGVPRYRFYSIEGGLRLLPSDSHVDGDSIVRNQNVWADSQNEPIHRNAWRNDVEYETLRAELASLAGLPPAPAIAELTATKPAKRRKADELALFDEAYYLNRYSDVRGAVAAAGFPDGRTHFERSGFDEGRDAFAFDDAWYATSYPEVAAEIATGRFMSHRHHYTAIGHLAGCLPHAPTAGADDAALFANFVSLGDNCEFGLVQQAAGVAPLDLLRFGGTGNDELGLILALKERFAAFGSAEDMRVKDDDGEWISFSRRYDITFHTQRKPALVSHAVMLAEEAERLRFLARKLVRDLEAPEKIFVRKSNKVVSEDLMCALYHALRGYGPAGGQPTLLWVSPADGAHPAGTVQTLAPGFLRGYIARLAPYESATDIRVEDWRPVCAAALAAAGPALARPSRADAEGHG